MALDFKPYWIRLDAASLPVRFGGFRRVFAAVGAKQVSVRLRADSRSTVIRRKVWEDGLVVPDTGQPLVEVTTDMEKMRNGMARPVVEGEALGRVSGPQGPTRTAKRAKVRRVGRMQKRRD